MLSPEGSGKPMQNNSLTRPYIIENDMSNELVISAIKIFQIFREICQQYVYQSEN